MLRIRLRRVGKKGKPSYRIVVAESTAPRDGAYIEWIGNYDPMANPPAITLKEDRAAQWLSKGAQPSDAVARILDKSGLFQRTEQFRTVTPKSDDEPAAAVTASLPTEVSVVETSPPPNATVEEAPTDEAPAETTLTEASEEESPADEAAEEAPAEEEPAEASVEETPVAEEAEEAPAEEEPDEASEK